MRSITMAAIISIIFEQLKRLTLKLPVANGHAFGDNSFSRHIMRHQRHHRPTLRGAVLRMCMIIIKTGTVGQNPVALHI